MQRSTRMHREGRFLAEITCAVHGGQFLLLIPVIHAGNPGSCSQVADNLYF